MKRFADITGTGLLAFSAFAVFLVLFGILGFILAKGAGVLSWEFLTQPPRAGMTEGGILPAIVGTAYLTVLATLASFPLGLAVAIYLAEYAHEGFFVSLVRTVIRNLAGVPSIIYGIFGVALFVSMLRMGTSLIASALTLALMNLPWIITAAEEALKEVPWSWREGALALGANKWQTIRRVVLKPALPGILTGVILAMSRAAGETAPILFTGVAFYAPRLPKSLSDEFMALPYHLYVLSTQHHDMAKAIPIAYGTALVLMGLTLLLNFVAFWLRNKFHVRY